MGADFGVGGCVDGVVVARSGCGEVAGGTGLVGR